MQALQIPDVKEFMGKLLTTELFDTFLISEASITTFTTFEIDGSYHADYFNSEERDPSGTLPSYPSWKQLRPLFYSLIKGKNTPLNFRIVFRLADYNVEKLLIQSGLSLRLSDVAGLFLNLHYDGKTVTFTTGTSLRIFTLDKALDHAWDDMIQRFFRQKQIPFVDC